jgi:hypothetical protein
MLRRWTLTAYPVVTGDRGYDLFSQAMADAANADPGVFWTERGARRAARFHTHTMGLPVALEAVRRDR